LPAVRSDEELRRLKVDFKNDEYRWRAVREREERNRKNAQDRFFCPVGGGEVEQRVKCGE